MKKSGTSICFPFFLTDRINLLRFREEGLTIILEKTLVQSNSDMCITGPLLLPQSQELLIDTKEEGHTLVLNKTLKLMTWKISGKT